MKLALITQDFPPDVGGIQTYSYEIAKRIYKKCDDFIVVAPDKPNADEVDKNLPFEVYRISTPNALLGLTAIPQILPILKKRGISHTFHAQWQSLALSFLAKKAGVIKHTAVAAHAREFFFNPFKEDSIKGKSYETYKHFLLKQADFFFPVSHYTSDILREHGIDDKKMKVVINGTNPELFYPLDTDALKNKYGFKDKKIIMTITRLIERKAVDTVLKALKLLKDDMPSLHYVVVGDGPLESDLKHLAGSLGVGKRVTFTGRIPYELVHEYYNFCDVYVMPSKTMLPEVEAFGIVFLEANACGKPSIGSKTGGISDAIIDGETGLLVEEQNPPELAKAIKKLFQNEPLRKKLGSQGRKRVENEANWDAVADKIFNLTRFIDKN